MFDRIYVLFKLVLYEREVLEPTVRWRSGAAQVAGHTGAHLKIWPRESNISRTGDGGVDACHEPPLMLITTKGDYHNKRNFFLSMSIPMRVGI